MQKVVGAVGEQVEVADDLLVLLFSELWVRLGVAHLQDLDEEEVCEVVFQKKGKRCGFEFFRKTFSRTRKARTPVRVATPILNKPPSSPESITYTGVDIMYSKILKNEEATRKFLPYVLICFWEEVKKNITK